MTSAGIDGKEEEVLLHMYLRDRGAGKLKIGE